MKKEAVLYRKMSGGRVECYACSRLCKIPEGSQGYCFVRKNVGGKLYLSNYGTIAAMQIDPIEKKPFNHFMPGSYAFSVGTSGCDWGCMFCQNYDISKRREVVGREIGPGHLVEMALESGAQSIAYTYNEPTIFIEYALDVAKLAHKRGLYNLFVTNGYMTKEAVAAMKGHIDAAVVDFKGNGDEKFLNKYIAVMNVERIKEAMLALKDAGVHVEVTDLVVPQAGDSLETCDALTKWIFEKMGPDTPLQFTRFHPDYKMLDYPETPYETLKEHHGVAKKNGLRYVYIGNAPGNPYEDTYCPGCGTRVIDRFGHYVMEWNLTEGNKCKKCGYEIFMFGTRPEKFKHREILSMS